MHTRPYRDLNDLTGMQRVLSAGLRDGGERHTIHPGDLAWWLFYLGADEPLETQISLWEDASGIRAWALFTPAEGLFDLFANPALADTPDYAAIHVWCEQEASRRIKALGGASVAVDFIADPDLRRRQQLEAWGYQLNPDRRRYLAFTQDLGLVAAPADLPAGAVIRPVLGESELEPRARPQRLAFKSSLSWDAYLARYRRFMHAPVYRREHDMGLVLADGQFAAVCIYWTDPLTAVGHFEPVATHPDFQRRGYGRTLLLECMRRMRQEGMTTATVNTHADDLGNVAFYQSCGFQIRHHMQSYKKEIA